MIRGAVSDEPSKPKSKSPGDPKPAVLDERRLTFTELEQLAAGRDADAWARQLVGELRDGRAIVRANAALALAACGKAEPELVALVRDSETSVALAAADAIKRLGTRVRSVLSPLAQAAAGAQPEVTDVIVAALADLVGSCDDELIAALDQTFDVAQKTIIAACGRLGARGVGVLIKAARTERTRIRVNGIGGLERFGKADATAALAVLGEIEANDSVPDVRGAAKQASLAVIAREKQVAVDRLPKLPDFEARKLSTSELAEQEAAIDIDEMIYALSDGRNHVRINAARGLSFNGGKAGRAEPAFGLLMRDSTPAVRREAAVAIGKLGPEGLAASADLVGALGDVEDDVAEAAQDVLAGFGDAAQPALVKGLEAGEPAHGRRVAELIAKLPRASAVLVEAFGSPAVNVQVNAAVGLGLLGGKVGAGLAVLQGARTGGDARTREAVRNALERLAPKAEAAPVVAIAGFEDGAMTAAELDKHKAALEKVGAAALVAFLQDGRDHVRGNAAIALGALGPAAISAARALGVRLRDDAARVRLSAAQALDKLGDAAVVDTADDLVGALGDSDAGVADAAANVLRARKGRMVGALVRGMETDKPAGGRRIALVIAALPDALDILCDAFESPAVNVQVNAALGLALLGPDRVGRGRRALEGARTGGDARTRQAVREALELLDGPRRSGPAEIAIDGFETKPLGPEAFADPAKLSVDALAPYLQDGRAVVRGNAAVALGALGPAARGSALALGVLMRDDDSRVRICAAGALDKLGDDVVREVGDYLVGALRGDAEVAAAVAKVLGPRKSKVQVALVKGLETDDEAHGRRILELINALPEPLEILTDAFDSPAENVQVNAAIGIGMLGAKRAGSAGRKRLEGARTGGFARTREAVFKALAMLDR